MAGSTAAELACQNSHVSFGLGFSLYSPSASSSDVMRLNMRKVVLLPTSVMRPSTGSVLVMELNLSAPPANEPPKIHLRPVIAEAGVFPLLLFTAGYTPEHCVILVDEPAALGAREGGPVAHNGAALEGMADKVAVWQRRLRQPQLRQLLGACRQVHLALRTRQRARQRCVRKPS
mmetsp:Transcript_40890/g.103604  ORF Transcript_40890/g.103604 Transcript_40890/m.103604 type:complete len:175 (+) Transcript_40890:85-609(+)